MEDRSARVHGSKKRKRADYTCWAKRAGMASDASEGSKLIAQPWSDARWPARMRYECTALSALSEDIRRPKRLGRALRLRRGYYPRGCPLEWPEVIDGHLANHRRGWWLLSCTATPPVPFRRVLPSLLAAPRLACSVASLSLCPEGYLPDQHLLQSTGLAGCQRRAKERRYAHEDASWEACPSSAGQAEPSRRLLHDATRKEKPAQRQERMHQPRIEPGSRRWQRCILSLYHCCCYSLPTGM